MPSSSFFFTLLIVVAIGAGIGYAAGLRHGRRRARESTGTHSELQERCIRLEAENKAQADAHQKILAERRSFDEDMEKKFTAAAADILKKNTSSLLETAQSQFSSLIDQTKSTLTERSAAIDVNLKNRLEPVGKTLGEFKTQLAELEISRKGAYEGLAKHLELMDVSQVRLRKETEKLSRALRNPRSRGRWGEYQLRNVFEFAGMNEHVDFIEQSSHRDDEGSLLRPDAVVRLPGGRQIVIDAKTPLDAYLQASEAETEEDADILFNQHAKAVAGHVAQLGSKRYAEGLGAYASTVDIVILFIPGESFFAEALRRQPDLFDRGVENKVVIAGPTTLIAVLKAVAHCWRQEKLADHANEIMRQGAELYERLHVFGKHVVKIGDRLDRTVAAYNDGVGSLEKRVLPVLRRIESTQGVRAKPAEERTPQPIATRAQTPQAKELESRPEENYSFISPPIAASGRDGDL